MNKDFRDCINTDFDSETFVYLDPPYLGSCATYNDMCKWTDANEKMLLDILDDLNSKNIKWALSNNLKYNNSLLSKWMANYNIHYLNYDYSSCNYHKKDKSKDVEVLITNY